MFCTRTLLKKKRLSRSTWLPQELLDKMQQRKNPLCVTVFWLGLAHKIVPVIANASFAVNGTPKKGLLLIEYSSGMSSFPRISSTCLASSKAFSKLQIYKNNSSRIILI